MADDDRPLFFHLMAYADAADRDVVDMVSGNPDWEPPGALREGIRAFADASVSDYQYPPSEGLTDLRKEIAARRAVDVERVHITGGAGEANYLAMASGLAEITGNEVILADPVYPYYAGRTKMLGAKPRYVAARDDGTLKPEDVRESASDETALLVINSPNNPTGAVYGKAVKRNLVAIAEEHDALLVSDEVYDHFDFSGDFYSGVAMDSSNIAVTNSFSKSMATTGLRIGYVVLPEWLVDSVRTRHMLVTVACSAPGQYAALRALRETSPEYYRDNRELLRERVDTFTKALDEAGATYTRPRGGFYVMAKFNDYPGTLSNAKQLIDEAGVAGMPGEAFGESHNEWHRFALVTPRVEKAADRLADYFS